MFLNDTNLLDQHFLVDKNVLNKLLEVSDLKSSDDVLEIGAGKGILTKEIASKVKSLTVIEKDVRLKKYLDNISNINVIYDDVLNTLLPKVDKIITSLPYSILEPFIYKIIKCDFNKLVMICGKNFADNIALKNTKLGILTSLYFNLNYIMDITPDSFDPKPKAMSSLIVLTKIDVNTLSKENKVLYYLYDYRYMKVKNALKEILIKLESITQKESRSIVSSFNIDNSLLEKEFDELSSLEVNKLVDCIKFDI